jgi:hypothetical protein
MQTEEGSKYSTVLDVMSTLLKKRNTAKTAMFASLNLIITACSSANVLVVATSTALEVLLACLYSTSF